MTEMMVVLKEQKIIYLLSLLSIAMIIDFFSGCLAAKITRTFTSKIGINGILRKVASMVLLFFFLPVALLIPVKTGIALLYVLYTGYLWMELQSILENYHKMGVNVNLFSQLIALLKKYLNH